MNKLYYKGLFILFALLNWGIPVYAAETPKYMAKNLDSPKRNICPIICNFMYPNGKVQGSGGAQALADQQNELKRRLVAKLYAEGLTTRTNMLKKALDDKKKALEESVTSPMKDKKEVLDSMQPYLIGIINHLSSIASLEASIAALDGTITITRDSGHAEADILNRCNCEDIVKEQSSTTEDAHE